MLTIDGSYGEGGGQILRTSLGLSILTNTPFKLINIRMSRPIPGLQAQHLQAIKVSEIFSNAEVEGSVLKNTEVIFKPKNFNPKNINIDIGTAGSVTLVLQSILIPLILHKGLKSQEISIDIKGGTDVAWSQPIDYFNNVLTFFLREYAKIQCNIKKRGYFPKGNGGVIIKIKPTHSIKKIEYLQKGKLKEIRGISHASKDLMKSKVVERQKSSCIHKLLEEYPNIPINIKEDYNNSDSTGSGITLWAIFENSIMGSDSLGKKGKSAELVGFEAAQSLLKNIKDNAPIDEYMADQLIPFLAILKGSFKVTKITDHLLSNIYVCEKFLNVKFEIKENEISVNNIIQ